MTGAMKNARLSAPHNVREVFAIGRARLHVGEAIVARPQLVWGVAGGMPVFEPRSIVQPVECLLGADMKAYNTRFLTCTSAGYAVKSFAHSKKVAEMLFYLCVD